MIIHNEPHPLAGQTIRIRFFNGGYFEFTVKDWADRVFRKSWLNANTAAARHYADRIGMTRRLPYNPDKPEADDRVIHGLIGKNVHLIHESEIVDEAVSMKEGA